MRKPDWETADEMTMGLVGDTGIEPVTPAV